MTFDTAPTKYAKSGGLHIAYRVFGEGEVDVVLVPGLTSNLDSDYWLRAEADEYTALAERFRCILFDKRGTGISDRVEGAPSLEERMDDVRAVMDAAGSAQAVIFGRADGGAMSILFAATYPERTLALILGNPRPRFTQAADYPFGPTPEEFEQQTAESVRLWGSREHALQLATRVGLETDEKALQELARRMRLGASPGAVRALSRMNADIDVRSVLPSVRVPTLILHESRAAGPAEYVVERILDSEAIELDDADVRKVLPKVEAFVSRALDESKRRAAEPDRVLATVLFTDLVGSTQTAVELGPRWPDLLREHNARIRRELARYSGRAIDTAGDGFFASGFDGPARAIRCANAIRDAVTELGLRIRVGVHTGECEVVDGKISGLAVVIGSRVAGHAEPGEVLVTGTVKDLVAGSGIEFESRGTRDLKGLGEWPVYAVAAA